ncbi:amidohydrolase family protein [Sphingomonas sp. JC676]|uniref:amidohydrolase family protein n=1 Tax=Sphingomonas sp. JC676 TaxID=2768065 RepID=UPI0016577801|nr:amidohydrolase family protein [Sphingomonas sp. JC676]MBC9035082.1 amidohydrolase family protein [Sphingomonas sp. JC676]
MRVFDAHQHFWKIGGPGQSWPDAEWPAIYRDFLPDDLRAAAEDFELVGSVLVQSQPADIDTDWMFETAGADPTVKAIVGWVDFERAGAPERIAALAARPRLRGLRPMLQSIEDSAWILRAEIAPSIEAMLAHGLRFDALIEPRHLGPLHQFATRWPDLPIVIDHGAKPFAARGELDPWRDDIAALATLPNLYCKLSGLRTEQSAGRPASDLAPYVAHLVELFPTRLMWGSDWPVLLHTGDSYADWIRTALDLAAPSTEDAKADLFERVATGFYGIDD